MEMIDTHKKVLTIFESVLSTAGLTENMYIKDIIQDSLSLMKIIVAIENEFNTFLDDIDFIALYDLDIKGFIHYANIK